MVFCIDTLKLKQISLTSPHSARIIDILSISSISLRRNGESLDLQTPHSQRREKVSPTHIESHQVDMSMLKKTSPSRNTRISMRRQRRTRENGVSTIKVLGTTPNNASPSSPTRPNWRLPSYRLILILIQILKEGIILSMLNPVPLSLPRLTKQTKRTRGSGTSLSLANVVQGGSTSFHCK